MIIDLDKILRDPKYDLEITTTEKEQDAALRRKKDLWSFFLSWAITLGLLVGLTVWLAFGQPMPEDKKWIFSILGGIVGSALTSLKKS